MKEIYENFDKNKRIDCFITGCDFPNSSMSVYFQYLDEVYAEVELDDLVAISDGENTFNDYFVELKKEYNRKKNREKSTTKLKQIYNEQLIVKSIVNKNIDKLSDVSFEYDTDLSVEFTEPINLELEKINLLLNDKVIGTIEINRNINDLKDFAEPYIDEKSEEKIIRKTYSLQKEFLRILGRNAEIYNSLGDGMFYLNIYIKDLKTNKIFVIDRNKIFIDFESAGPKVFIPNI